METCEHLTLNYECKIVSNRVIIEKELIGFIEWHTLKCSYCGDIITVPEHISTTIIRFLPRVCFYIVAIPIFILWKVINYAFLKYF
jgi:hypothetical protein